MALSIVGTPQKRSVASRFASTMDYHVWSTMLEAYHELRQKQNNQRTQRSVAGDLGQPMHRNRSTRLLKASHSD